MLVPRAAVGLGIALMFGLPKLGNFSAFVDEVAGSGAPAPTLLAVGLTLVELVGGLLIAVGLFTRLAGLALMLAMLGVMTVPSPGGIPWDTTPFALGGYVFAVIGAGRISLDHAILARLSGAGAERR